MRFQKTFISLKQLNLDFPHTHIKNPLIINNGIQKRIYRK